MKRREFFTLLSSAVAAWPLATRAQQGSQMPRVGYIISASEGDAEAQARRAAFVDALRKLGWVDGRNIRIDYRWGAIVGRQRAAAAELVRLAPNVILAAGNGIAEALRQETRIIPIVFTDAPDPLSSGLVDSLARPGGNVTGFTSYDLPMGGKWLQMLKEVAPGIKRVLVILVLGNTIQEAF